MKKYWIYVSLAAMSIFFACHEQETSHHAGENNEPGEKPNYSETSVPNDTISGTTFASGKAPKAQPDNDYQTTGSGEGMNSGTGDHMSSGAPDEQKTNKGGVKTPSGISKYRMDSLDKNQQRERRNENAAGSGVNSNQSGQTDRSKHKK